MTLILDKGATEMGRWPVKASSKVPAQGGWLEGSPFWVLPHTTILTPCDSLESKPMVSELSSPNPRLSGLWPPSYSRQVLILNGSAPRLNYHTVLTTSSFPSTGLVCQLPPRVAKGGPLQG